MIRLMGSCRNALFEKRSFARRGQLSSRFGKLKNIIGWLVVCLQNLYWSFGLGPEDQASESGKAAVVGSFTNEGHPAN